MSRKTTAPRRNAAKSSGRAPRKKARSIRRRPAAPSSKRLRKPMLIGALFFSGAVLVALGVLGGFLDGYGQKDRAQQSEVIVVLGAGVRADGLAGKSLKRRVLHAVDLYERGYAPRILMTGGVGKNPPAEAAVAAELAFASGVPRSAVFLEDRSTSTWENATFATEICREQGWEKLLLVSDPFHLWRAERNFARRGFPVASSPAPNERAQRETLTQIFWATREACLVARDWVLRRV